jgi:hypothetical protein
MKSGCVCTAAACRAVGSKAGRPIFDNVPQPEDAPQILGSRLVSGPPRPRERLARLPAWLGSLLDAPPNYAAVRVGFDDETTFKAFFNLDTLNAGCAGHRCSCSLLMTPRGFTARLRLRLAAVALATAVLQAAPQSLNQIDDVAFLLLRLHHFDLLARCFALHQFL